jgi:hypothetical protein
MLPCIRRKQSNKEDERDQPSKPIFDSLPMRIYDMARFGTSLWWTRVDSASIPGASETFELLLSTAHEDKLVEAVTATKL